MSIIKNNDHDVHAKITGTNDAPCTNTCKWFWSLIFLVSLFLLYYNYCEHVTDDLLEGW